MVSAAGRRRLSSQLTVRLSLVAVVAAAAESVRETPTTWACCPAADAGERDAAGRTASGRRRGTREATVAPACRRV